MTDGRRREFAAFCANVEDVPDPQAAETFERSRLNWGECEKDPHDDLLEWHRRLIRLRRKIPDLPTDVWNMSQVSLMSMRNGL